MRRVIGWLVAPLFWLLFGVTLVMYEVAGRLARPFGLRRFEWTMASLQRTLVRVFTVFGVDLQVRRDPAVVPDAAYVVVANHQSLFDIPLVGGLLYANLPKYVAKRELASGIPAISLNLTVGRHALIDRGDADQALAEIEALGRRSQERGTSAVIFPEGTRSRDGRLGRFRRTGMLALLGAAPDLPVVPVAIDGSWRFNSIPPYPVGRRVVVTIGAPMARDRDDEALAAAAEAFIRGHLGQPVEELPPGEAPAADVG